MRKVLLKYITQSDIDRGYKLDDVFLVKINQNGDYEVEGGYTFYSYQVVEIRDTQWQPKDTIVESVINQFRERSKVGIKKYGVTLDREDLTPLQWLIHLSEELQDAILYIEKLKQDMK